MSVIHVCCLGGCFASSQPSLHVWVGDPCCCIDGRTTNQMHHKHAHNGRFPSEAVNDIWSVVVPFAVPNCFPRRAADQAKEPTFQHTLDGQTLQNCHSRGPPPRAQRTAVTPQTATKVAMAQVNQKKLDRSHTEQPTRRMALGTATKAETSQNRSTTRRHALRPNLETSHNRSTTPRQVQRPKRDKSSTTRRQMQRPKLETSQNRDPRHLSQRGDEGEEGGREEGGRSAIKASPNLDLDNSSHVRLFAQKWHAVSSWWACKEI